MRHLHKAVNPVFVLSTGLLIINDWLLKPLWHNGFTGKLSDFAGLFAFPFCWSILFPRYTKGIHIATALLFLVWKSPLVQPLLDAIGNRGWPIGRTVDLTDAIALVSTGFSYFVFQRPTPARIRPVAAYAVLGVSCLAFMATAQRPGEYRRYEVVDRAYHFPFSKTELITRINAVEMEEISKLRKYSQIDFDQERNVFHFHGSNDTLAILLQEKELLLQDTVDSKTSYGWFRIWGDENHSVLKLVSVNRYAFYNSNRDFEAIAVKQFEKQMVKKIRNGLTNH